MNINRGKRRSADAGPMGDVREGILSRRTVLGGVGALPVLYGIGIAAPGSSGASAWPASPVSPVVPKATGALERGTERRYNAPLLTPGTRLVMPRGITAVAIENYYRHPHLASAETAWPKVAASDGTTVDASTVPERGASTRIAMLGGFEEGWYELIHLSGRADRVTWDARRFPFLWLYGEFGATSEAPYHDVFYTLAMQPFSHNPYSRKTVAT